MSQPLSHNQRSLVTGFSILACAALLLVLSAVNVSAQASNPNSGSTPSGLKPGSPAGSYGLSGFDNVNLFNGNLNFHLPLIGVGGRGSAKMQMMLAIDSVHWTVDSEGGLNNSANPNWWTPIKVGYGPGVLQGRGITWTTEQTNITTYLPRLTFTAPDGTEYELRDKAYNGQPKQHGVNRGRIFISTDGTAVTFISDSDIVDAYTEAHFYPTGWLLMSDGTRYRIGNTNGTSGGLVLKIIDRNGNLLTFTYDSFNRVSTITDSLNRQVSIAYDIADPSRARYFYDLITYKGFGGVSRSLKVWHTLLSKTLRSDYSGTMSYHDLFPALSSDTNQYKPSGITTAVELPDGRTYELRYNPWGELARVELPTGGAIEYDYANFPGADYSQAIHRRATVRRVYKDKNDLSTAFESRQVYSQVYTTTPRRAEIEVKQYDVSGNMLTHEKHYFEGNPVDSLSIAPTDYSMWSDGREWKTEALSLSETNAAVLRRVEMTWQQSSGTLMGLNVWWQSGSSGQPSMNPHVVETITTLMDSTPYKVSKQTAINPVTQADSFDQYGNQTDAWETDYGDGVPGAWLQHTHTDYLTTNTINGTSYSYDTIAGTSSSPDVANTIHLRRLSKEQLIYTVNPTSGADISTAADTKLYYDQTSLYPAYSDISGLDSSYTASRMARGNLTRTSRWRDLPTSAWLNTDAVYDIAGNITSSIDARGNISTFNFSDCFGSPNGEARTNTPPTELGTQHSYAFVTIISNALSQISHAQYDFYLGMPVDGEDINGVVASGYYTNAQGQTDPLDRPFKVVAAVGTSAQSQSSFSYNDAARIITVTRDKSAYNDNLLKTETLYDKLGRTTETHTYESVTAYVTSKQEYDALGRVKRVYNPYRTTSDPTYGWTEKTYDALGRVTVVKTSDNAQVTSGYDNNRVTVTEQAGKQRRSVTDGLGRLVQVIEDPNGLNYQTNYLYDVLGNLRRVEQGAQYRYFMYDSLSRLLRAKNPEQDANASITPSLTDPLTNQSAWAMACAYDANGNLEMRTDARNITRTYAYDVLNRNTTVTYSQNANTPDITNRYDNASLTYGKGKLWQTETSGSEGTLITINSLDALGRVLSQSQQFKTSGVWSAAYTTQRAYSITGDISVETYPSGHTVNYAYDNAAKLASFSGNLGDGVSRTYASNISYDEGGRMLEEQYGTQTALYRKLRYNTRGQLYDVRLSTLSRAQSSTDWDRGCLAFYYSVNNQAWGGSSTDNDGNVTKAEMYVPNADGSYNMLQDQYAYDALNRLQSVGEYQWGAQNVFTQSYDYDRWGNRTINQSSSANINKQLFTVNTANNRLGVPSGQSGQMNYDVSGNLTTDTYSRADTTRTYDGDDRLVANTDTSNQMSRYTYDAVGRRVRRNVNNQETWQVYGIGAELLAEYTANAAATSVQKEYGYRGGGLLVTATSGADIEWLVDDPLSTPRMIVDKTGTLAGTKRHDYLPFGEEIFAGTGGRTTAQGYIGDNVRQKYTRFERDTETSLDFAEARYFSSNQGRFISLDPASSSMRPIDPQSFNRYSYVGNNPVNRIDPSGLDWQNHAGQQGVSQYYTSSLYELDRVLRGSLDGRHSRTSGTFDDFYDQAFLASIMEGLIDDLYSGTGFLDTPWTSETEGQVEVTAEVTGTVLDGVFEPVDAGVPQATDTSTMIIFWYGGGKNPFGHISYIIMQDDESYSWQAQGLNEWTRNTPSSVYTDSRSTIAGGVGIVLDFKDPLINAKFQEALKGAYTSSLGINIPYHPTYNNCAMAFNVAYDAIRKDIGGSRRLNSIRPADVYKFINENLSQYIRSTKDFPKH